ncbi:MAG: hypothetical protein HY906_20550 [Deltaproteobacteria bacterium]|nr:hypothetical protein [Deltaproteobacteria bacterium]
MSKSWLAVLLVAGVAGCGGNITPVNGWGDGGGNIDAAADDGGGGNPDGTVAQHDAGCGLRTCESAGASCGPIGDGCGGTLECGGCTPPASCGGGGTPSVCGGTAGCVPKTCAGLGANCGPLGDGCGSLLQCGDCTPPETCGGGGTYFACGQNPPGCQPKTCADLGFNCGAAGDGCGNLITGGCGTCTAPDICGGGGVPGVCGGGTPPDGGVPCVNLCLQQVDCPTGTTSVSGTVYAPNGKEPLYGALVYVPNAAVQPFTPGVSCLRCEDQVSGSPLVSTTTDYRGQFKLDDMPVGTNIPLVIQLGRWRRQITIPSVSQCVDTALAATLTRLPRNKSEGDIPLTAMVTGNVDQLECVLRKIGIDAAEFTLPSGNGRIRMYHENGVSRMTSSGPNLPDANTLWDTQAHLDQYDMVIFACEGGHYDKGAGEKGRVRAYADKGGRVFTTHYSYTWLYDNDPWGCGDGCTTVGHTVGAWNYGSGSGSSTTGTIDTSFPKGQAFSQWLGVVGALVGPNQITINDWRHDLDSVYPAPTAQRWIYAGATSFVEHATFNTPVGTPADQQCGRVLFSDFHVQNAGSLNGDYLFDPANCNQTADLTAQEKVLEFMLFDLAACITPDVPPPPTCTPKTCAQLGANCGFIGDGCGNAIDCGPCVLPETCGGCGVPNVCCVPGCLPRTCAQLGLQCGPAGDGCGNIIDCGPCVPPDTCGGGGVPGVCGHSSCIPLTCETAGAECGLIGDGCGGSVDCGPCILPETCGGGGVANICGIIG